MPALLSAESLSIRVAGRTLVDGLSLSIGAGDRVALLGPNGVGKTLTLHTLCGLRTPSAGAVRLAGTLVGELPLRERARRIGLLLQALEDPFPTRVLETALMGRHARLGLWQWETAEDEALARAALETMDIDTLAGREAATLSGGERRRLGLATLLVQDPDVLLLDEPLNHLDPRHQFDVLATLDELAGRGKAVIASLHDPALALRHCTHALLLHGDGRWRFGPAITLLEPAVLGSLYDVPFHRFAAQDVVTQEVILPVPPRSA